MTPRPLARWEMDLSICFSRAVGALVLLGLGGVVSGAEARRVNYDETKVGKDPLPPLMAASDGSKVETADDWKSKRRGEILELFRNHVFGYTPAIGSDLKVEVTEKKDGALQGMAVRWLLHLSLPSVPQWEGIDLMVYVPKGLPKPVPVVVGLSFQGNHAVTTETDVPISKKWMRPGKQEGQVVANRATEKARGAESSRWPLKMIMEHGCALATAYYGDIEPDHADGWKDGLRGAVGLKKVDNEWGAIGAWAWGLSRMLDACQQIDGVDASRAAVIGHSRLGKTSLWAGAQDERFGIVISNNSGEGGAAPARRDFGETTKIITSAFPHWFCKRYSTYAEPNTHLLPVDSHMLGALAAPRGLYIASAVEDEWADPKGEFITAREVEPVYRLFGKDGVGVSDQPAIDHPVGAQVRYHVRTGKHDVVDFDWEQYLKFVGALLKP
ncbi:MAG: acetylxylan esterase [Verrucomicrobiaceae bacterium]|nr:acetylxylan esterase [Verrucomicrobiaceae bacterium]